MAESQQHKLDRVRRPRVQITYDVETGGAMEKKHLPFVVGVLADLSGQRKEPLPPLKQRSFVDNMRQNRVEGWQGPAGSFVYLVLRSDAVDVDYGTMEGYASLGIPYMPHIAPTKRW